ncbi:hypothetical protein F4561_000508 [Lipingzhangella halophila]|uniref:Septum formation-related domain-containing protein n=1 Tax=Lipingzhangella halophila TaxID=1783352 RepID=A0A7W7RCY7_9ACTN|nr:septum formation family protein [Lipingzhangella halophila]MBB4929688.1 hypothetical protein [Lipingzhangella halophila]
MGFPRYVDLERLLLAESLRPFLRSAATGAVALSAVLVLSSCGIAQRLADAAERGGAPPPSGSGSEQTDSDGGGGDPAGGESDDILGVSVGDCVNDDSMSDEVTEMPTVDCAEPHDSEVIAVEELDGDRPYPGDSVVGTEASDICTGAAFEDYIGVPWIESIYETREYTPLEEGWEAGDYEVICVAYEPGTALTGSIADSYE